MISQVSASDNFTEIDDIAHGNLVYAELTPVPVPDYYYWVIGGTQNSFYQNIHHENEVNLSDEIILTSNIDDNSSNFIISMVNRTSDGNATLLINAKHNETGFIVFSFVNGQKFNLSNGSLRYDFNNLKKGEYSFDFYYSGDETFANSTYKNVIFDIPSFHTNIVPDKDNLAMYYKNGSRFVISLFDDLNRPLVNKTIKFRINSKVYYKSTNSNGKTSLPINLNPGNYTLEAVYVGVTPISGCSYNATVCVLPTLESNDLVKIYKNGSQYIVKALDGQGNPLVNSTVRFNINGVFYNRSTNNDGLARLNIKLDPGDYIITAENIDGYKLSNNIKVLPSVISKDLVKIYMNASQFNVEIINKTGDSISNSKVQFNINGVFYNRTTNSNGVAKLNIKLNPGKYVITTINLVDGCKVSNTILVTSYLCTQDLVKFYRNNSKFEAKLVDSSYNPLVNHKITFEINGVKYVRTTNNNGIARLNINLLPGYYDIKTTSGEFTVINHIKVLNTLLMPKLNIPNYDPYYTFIDWLDEMPNGYSYSVHGLDYYPVMVLDGNGNPYANQSVIFNVDGVDYYRTTNASGIAIFENITVDGNYHLVKTYYNGCSVQQDVRRVHIF